MHQILSASRLFILPVMLEVPFLISLRSALFSDDQMERTPRSCRTSPSVPIKSFHQHLQRSSPPHSLDSSPNNGLEPSQHQSNTNANPSPSPSVFSLTQSGLQELMRKSGNVISTEVGCGPAYSRVERLVFVLSK